MSKIATSVVAATQSWRSRVIEVLRSSRMILTRTKEDRGREKVVLSLCSME